MGSNVYKIVFLKPDGSDSVCNIDKHDSAPRTVGLLYQTIVEKNKGSVRIRSVNRNDQVDFFLKIGRIIPENSQRDVNAGEVAYWGQSSCISIFLKKKRAYNAVNIIGFVENLDFFSKLKFGEPIVLTIEDLYIANKIENDLE